MASELKPCPFCGGNARLDSNNFGTPMVRCDACGASVYAHPNVDVACENWNRRPPQAGEAVTEAMVEAACKGFYGPKWKFTEGSSARIHMRAALQAALSAKGE